MEGDRPSGDLDEDHKDHRDHRDKKARAGSHTRHGTPPSLLACTAGILRARQGTPAHTTGQTRVTTRKKKEGKHRDQGTIKAQLRHN